MSIWTDIIKYNIVNKIFGSSNSGKLEFRQEIEIDTENTTTFKKIATFTPQLNGVLSQIIIKFKSLSGGNSGNVKTIEIRDKNGNVVASEFDTSVSDIFFTDFPVNAFQKYEIYFKNSQEIGSRYSVYVPEKVLFSYYVCEKNGYILLKSDI